MARILIIGIDGASFPLTEKWMGEGRLPHIAALAEHGGLMPLQGLTPPVTIPAWTTCVTGVNPGRHGMVDFTEQIPGKYAIRFLNASDRKVPALWNILTEAGRRVCILGVPGTYPPEAVNGIVMSGFDSPVADAVSPAFVYPPEAYPEVKRWRFAGFQEHRISPGWHKKALHMLEASIIEKTGICKNLLEKENWDLFMAVFGEADTVSHHFWPLEDENSPRRNPCLNTLDHPIRSIYEKLDRMVGILSEAAGKEALVIIVSDHGFGGAGIKALHINNYLAEHGWIAYAAPKRNLLKNLALRLLPAKGRGGLFRRFQPMAERLESNARSGGIEWTQTRAWSDELDYFPSVRINLEGREPGGIVPYDAYQETVRQICLLLEKSPAIDQAIPREEMYSGPWTCRAPDIILELAWEEGYRYSCTRAHGGASIELLRPEQWFGGKEKGNSGVHRNPAILVSNRPIASSHPALSDIAPTVLDFLKVPFSGMEGTSLFMSDKRAQGMPGEEWQSGEKKEYTFDEEQIIEARMRALGYFE